MEANADKFVTNEEYMNAVPRPTYDERYAIDLNILANGQRKPIEVNRKMVILDGYVRYELLGNRGLKIKFKFVDVDDELSYVVESNVMQRHLNVFQRVQTMYNLFRERRLESREKDLTSQYDILYALKEGYDTTELLVQSTGYKDRRIRGILKELTDDYTLTRKEQKEGHKKFFVYTVNPRGEAILDKAKLRPLNGVDVLIGKTIGVNRASVMYASTILEKGDKDLIKKCQSGELGVGSAYRILMGGKAVKDIWWKATDNIKCPHCEHIAKKTEYTKVD